MSAHDDQHKTRIMYWIRDMMEVHGLNYSQWGRRAGVSPTTISRFMSGKCPHVPSSRTLAAMAHVVGSQPPLVHEDRIVEMVVLPMLSSAQVQAISMGGASLDQSIEAATENVVTSALRYKDAFIVELCSSTMDMAGIMKGDQVVVAPHEDKRDGVTVVVATDYGASAYRYLPPFLMPVTSDRTMQPVRIHKHITILGVVVQLIRNLI